MIKSIHIRNFQSHKDTELLLDPGINVITGPSDSGKTAILRSLRWLIWNRPQGDSFRSYWNGDTEVEVVISKNSQTLVVNRIRTKSQNVYRLGRTVFQAIKSEVPEEIKQTLNLNELNVQYQLDNPFLLMDSPGDVAKYFNEIAHLDMIDRGLYNVNKWIRQLEQDISYEEQRKKSLEKQIKEYEYLDELEKDIQVVEKMEQYKNHLDQQCSVLYRLVTEVKTITQQIQEGQRWLGLAELTDTCVDLITKSEQLELVLHEITIVDSRIQENEHILQRLQNKFDSEMPNICPLCGQQISTQMVRTK